MERTKIDAATTAAGYASQEKISTAHDQNALTLADKQIAASSDLADKQIAATSALTDKQIASSEKLADKQISANASADKRRAITSLLTIAAQSSASMTEFLARASNEITNTDMDGTAKDAAIAQLNSFVSQASSHTDSWLNGSPATDGTPEIPAVTHEEHGYYDPISDTYGPPVTIVDTPAVPARPASAARPGVLSVIQSLFA